MADDKTLSVRIPTRATARLYREVIDLLRLTSGLKRLLASSLEALPDGELPSREWAELYHRYNSVLKWCLAEERARLTLKESATASLEPIEEGEELIAAVDLLTDEEFKAATERRGARRG